MLTSQQCNYLAWQLTRKVADGSLESLAPTLMDSQVDLNPHQVEAALFACRNPLSRGVILADEVGLGKTIEAGLVIAQSWAERKRKILIIVPANLRKQWYQELADKFGLRSFILETKSYNALKKKSTHQPFLYNEGAVICSYQFARNKAKDLKQIAWDLVVLDEAHRLRNVYKNGNVMAKALKDALSHVNNKILLTATPLQNSLLELYGLVSMIDERIFGDLDSFRQQFAQGAKDQQLAQLKQRLAPICKRTLRSQVQPFVSYTARRALVEDFNPSHEEQQLSKLVADYLRRPQLEALPEGQRQLISLVLWKLLASSTQAIAGALETMANRLQAKLDQAEIDALADCLDEDYEALAGTMDEFGDDDIEEDDVLSPAKKHAIATEIEELKGFCELAKNIRQQSKGQALLSALEKAFAAMSELGAAQKAIIFTESRRTQDYLQQLLKDTDYGKGLVLFNGTNTSPEAQKIYKSWFERHRDTDRVTGSKTADTRAALVDYFREQGTVMIATEAGAEGINLQFCSLVINYDLPWNPQRIEQRIGRCHRYGQKHDVVVVNFVDRSNAADSRVYDLLAEKFQLFEGVFGASDEVLGAIGSGVDFEKRIAAIYKECRDTQTIEASFTELQQELSHDINSALLKTRDLLLGHFDEKVLHRIKTDAASVRDTHEKWLLQLTQAMLEKHQYLYATFDTNGFDLPQPFTHSPVALPAGRYDLARVNDHAHVYRLSHPFAQAMIEQAKQTAFTSASLVFDYAAYGVQLSTIRPLCGQTGQLSVRLLTINSLGREEEHLVVSAITASGVVLAESDPEKLLKIPAKVLASSIDLTLQPTLLQDIEQRKLRILESVNIRNLSFFEQEVIKLDDWADDLKSGLESEIKQFDREIKEARRTATVAATLPEKLKWQKEIRDLESKRNKMRRALFDRQDEIESERNQLIAELEGQLEQQVTERELFALEWRLT